MAWSAVRRPGSRSSACFSRSPALQGPRVSMSTDHRNPRPKEPPKGWRRNVKEGPQRVYLHGSRHALARRPRCGRRVRVRPLDRRGPDGGRAAASRAPGARRARPRGRADLGSRRARDGRRRSPGDPGPRPSPPAPSRRSWATRPTIRCSPRTRPAGVRPCGCPRPWSRASSPAASSTATCCTPPAWSTRSRSACAPVAARPSSPGSAAPSASSPSATATCSTSPAPASRARCRPREARERLVRALADDPPPGTAVMLLDGYGEIELSSLDAERWLAEHFGTADHPGLASGAGRRVARAAAAPAAGQRARRPAPHRPPAARRSARTAARGDGRELPPGRARPPRPDRARDRGAARRHRRSRTRPKSLGSCS